MLPAQNNPPSYFCLFASGSPDSSASERFEAVLVESSFGSVEDTACTFSDLSSSSITIVAAGVWGLLIAMPFETAVVAVAVEAEVAFCSAFFRSVS